MKKFLMSSLCAASLLGMVSCADDLDLRGPGGDGNVTFTVSVPGEMTRAMGDGTTAKTLKYFVYDADALKEGKTPAEALVIGNGSTSFSGTDLSTTVSLDLIQGKNYTIAFYAYYNMNNVMEFSADNGTVTINYAKMSTTSTAKDHDAFYAAEDFEVKGAINRTVELKRPMAQINFGTTDYDTTNPFIENYYGSSLRSRIKTTACNTLNLITGEASNPVEFYVDTPTKTISETFPVKDVTATWLTCNYVLVPKDAPLADISLETYRGTTLVNSFDVTNVPLERNYRTNIYGSLLTSSADFVITKDPILGDFPGNNIYVWKGEIKTPTADAEGNYTINNPAELAGIAKLVNSGNTLSGKTVTLAADLDLNNNQWTPIGTATTPFCGTFDGAGHSIYNLAISLKGKQSTNVGLFGSIDSGSKVKNFTIDGAKIDATGYSGKSIVGVAAAVGRTYRGYGVDNVTVKNADIKAYRQTGGVVGQAGYANVTNCTAENVNIKLVFEYDPSDQDALNGYTNCDKAGAIFGQGTEGNYLHTGNSARNCRIEGYRHIGGLFGYVNSNAKISDNTAENITVVQTLEYNYKKIAAGALMGTVSGWYVAQGGIYNGGTDGNTASNVELIYPVSVTTIQDAVAQISAGGIVEIAADMDFSVLPGTLSITKPTKIVVPAGKTVKLGNGQLENNSELTLEGDGSVESAGILVFNANGAKLTIESGTYTANNGNPYNVNHLIQSEGDVVINGGKFVAAATSGANYAFNLNAAMGSKPATVVINGGEFNSATAYAANFYGNGKPALTAKVTVNGGTFHGKNGGAMAGNSVDVTINDGTFVGDGDGLFHGFYLAAQATNAQYAYATINGGNFWGANGVALGTNKDAHLTVKGGFVNKTTGFSPAEGYSVAAASKSLTVDGKTYTFVYQVVKQ